MYCVCKQHVELAIDKFVDDYEDAPDIVSLITTKFSEWGSAATCDMCDGIAEYLVVSRMLIQIAAVGKLKEKYLVLGIAEYAKRLGPYVKLVLTEVADERAPETMSAAEEAIVREREGERLLAQIKPEAHVVALALDGELVERGSRGPARSISHVWAKPRGFCYWREQRARARGAEARPAEAELGRMTLPHQLMRLVLVEQVYRAVKINRGEPYHK